MRSLLPSFVRFPLYALLLFFSTLMIKFDFMAGEFKEDSLTERAQETFLLIGIIILVISSIKFEAFRYFNSILSLFFLTHLIRELDSILDSVFDGLWQILAFSVVGIAIVILIKHGKLFWKQVAEIQHQFAFGIFTVGLLTLHVFSRLYGKGTNWENLMGDGYFRTIKDASEESIELLGYTIILISIGELFYLSKKQNSIN
ncbi:hypothetical protein [Psychroflexus planctonicus]|nr:hypothetical protein [Psychroflexus planctonicus]